MYLCVFLFVQAKTLMSHDKFWLASDLLQGEAREARTLQRPEPRDASARAPRGAGGASGVRTLRDRRRLFHRVARMVRAVGSAIGGERLRGWVSIVQGAQQCPH